LLAAARRRRGSGDRVLDAGEQVKADVLGIAANVSAARIGVQQRARLDPIFIGGIHLQGLGAGIAMLVAPVVVFIVIAPVSCVLLLKAGAALGTPGHLAGERIP